MGWLGGGLVLLLNLWYLPEDLSKRAFGAMSLVLVLIVDLLLLNLLMVGVVIKDGDSPNRMLISIAIYAVVYLLTALSLRWLIAGRNVDEGSARHSRP